MAALEAREAILKKEVAALEAAKVQAVREGEKTKIALALEELKLKALREDVQKEADLRHADLMEEQASRDPEFESALEKFILRRHKERGARAAKKARQG